MRPRRAAILNLQGKTTAVFRMGRCFHRVVEPIGLAPHRRGTKKTEIAARRRATSGARRGRNERSVRHGTAPPDCYRGADDAKSIRVCDPISLPTISRLEKLHDSSLARSPTQLRTMRVRPAAVAIGASTQSLQVDRLRCRSICALQHAKNSKTRYLNC